MSLATTKPSQPLCLRLLRCTGQIYALQENEEVDNCSPFVFVLSLCVSRGACIHFRNSPERKCYHKYPWQQIVAIWMKDWKKIMTYNNQSTAIIRWATALHSPDTATGRLVRQLYAIQDTGLDEADVISRRRQHVCACWQLCTCEHLCTHVRTDQHTCHIDPFCSEGTQRYVILSCHLYIYFLDVFFSISRRIMLHGFNVCSSMSPSVVVILILI